MSDGPFTLPPSVGDESTVMSGFVNCLWFDTRAQEAAEFYTGLFPESEIHGITPYVGGDRDA